VHTCSLYIVKNSDPNTATHDVAISVVLTTTRAPIPTASRDREFDNLESRDWKFKSGIAIPSHNRYSTIAHITDFAPFEIRCWGSILQMLRLHPSSIAVWSATAHGHIVSRLSPMLWSAWSDCNPPSKWGHVSAVWFIYCCCPHSESWFDKMLSAQICRKRFSRSHVRRLSSRVDESPDCEIRPTTGHGYTLVMLRYRKYRYIDIGYS